MELVVTPSVKVYKHEEKEEQTELLKKNITKKLSSKGINASGTIYRGEIHFEIEENDIAEAVHHLESLPGIGSVAPGIKVEAEPEKIAEKFQEQEIEPREFQISLIPEDQKLEEKIVETLREEGWSLTENPDIDMTVRKTEGKEKDYFIISLHTSKGIGGLPTDPEKIVVTTFRDRADAYASYIYLRKGFEVHPLTIEKNTDSLKEGIRFLEEYIPHTKPLVLKSDSWQEGVEKAVKTIKPEKVITGRIKGEKSFIDTDEIGVPVEEPLTDMKENEVLQMYENIRPVIL